MSRNLRKKTSPYGQSRSARAPKKRHHMSNLAPLVPQKHRRKGICARLRATGPAAIIDYHRVHLNHITKLLAMTNS